MRRHSSLMISGILALVLAGCDSPLSPSEVAGTYVLVSIDGSPLPAVGMDNEWSTITVLADTLWLHTDRSGEEVSIVEIESHSEGEESTTTETFRQDFGYTLKDRRIEIGYLCPPNANCLAPPHLVGYVTADGLELTSAYGEMIFRRN